MPSAPARQRCAANVVLGCVHAILECARQHSPGGLWKRARSCGLRKHASMLVLTLMLMAHPARSYGTTCVMQTLNSCRVRLSHPADQPACWRVEVCSDAHIRLLALMHVPACLCVCRGEGELHYAMHAAMRPNAANAAARDMSVRAVEEGSMLVAVPLGGWVLAGELQRARATHVHQGHCMRMCALVERSVWKAALPKEGSLPI